MGNFIRIFHDTFCTTGLVLAVLFSADQAVSAPVSGVIGADDRVAVDFQNFPWLGQVRSSGYCSGTLVSPNYVLTAGHCFANGSGDAISGRKAYFAWQRSGASAKKTITGTVEAGEFKTGFLTRLRDWALIRLDEPIRLERYPRLTGIPSDKDIRNLVVSNYGYPGDLGLATAVTHQNCRVVDWFGGSHESFYSHCDASPGNSGGPVTTRISGEEVIIAVTSQGIIHSFFGNLIDASLSFELKKFLPIVERDLQN